MDLGVFEVKIRLVGEKAVPVVLLAHRVESPIRGFGVHENNSRVRVSGVVVGPHIEVTVGTIRVRARGLEPRMVGGGVVDDDVDNDADSAVVCLFDQLTEIVHGSVHGIDGGVVGDVVPAVSAR